MRKAVTAVEMRRIREEAARFPARPLKNPARCVWVKRTAREHEVTPRTIYRYIRGVAS